MNSVVIDQEYRENHICRNCENWDHCTYLCCDSGDYTRPYDGLTCDSFEERE